jgi:hypothetical protein
MAAFGTQPEVSAQNAVRLLTRASVQDANGSSLRSPKKCIPTRIVQDPAQAATLWDITTRTGAAHGLTLS